MVRGRNSVKKEYYRDSRDVRALSEFLREAVDVEREEASSSSNARQEGPSPAPAAQNSKQQGQTTAQPRKKKRPIPGFRFKSPSEPKSPTLQKLEEMFADSIDGQVIEQIHEQMRPDINACAEALIALASDPCPASQHLAPDAQPELQSCSLGPSTGGKSLWESIPPDCQLLISDMLGAKDLASAAATCKSFARLAALRFASLDVIRCRKGSTFRSLPGMIASHQQATQLELNGFAADLGHIVHFESLSAALRRGFDSTMSRRVPLTHLQLQGCAALDLDALQLLLDAVPTIQALDISRSVNIDDAAVKTLAQYEPGPADAAVHEVMESIQLEASGYAHTAATEPLRGAPARGGGSIFLRRNGRDITFGSTAIRMSPAVAALLQRHASARKGLDDAEPSTSNEGAPAAEAAASEQQADLEEHMGPETLPAGLTGLILKGCGATEAGVRALFSSTARCVKTLRTLDVSQCSGVKLSFLATLPDSSALEVLKADGCSSLTTVTAHLSANSTLREMSVQRCPNLRTVDLGAPALQLFSASGAVALSALALSAPSLRQLHAVHCRNLEELSVNGPTEPSALQELNLEGCSSLPGASLSALIAASPGLRLCNLSSCRQLTQLVVPEIVALDELDVSKSAVRTIVCSTSTLRVLAARRCFALESVLLAAPTELCDVHNCARLQRVDVPSERAVHCRWRNPTLEVGGCGSLSDGARRNIRTWASKLRTT